MKIEREKTLPLIQRVLTEMYELSKGEWVEIEKHSIYNTAKKFELKPQFVPAICEFLLENKIFEFNFKRTRKTLVKTHYRSLDSLFPIVDAAMCIFDLQRKMQSPEYFVKKIKRFKDSEMKKIELLIFEKKEMYGIDDICYFMFLDGYNHSICQAKVYGVEKDDFNNFSHKIKFVNPISQVSDKKEVFDSMELFQTPELLLNYLQQNISKLK